MLNSLRGRPPEEIEEIFSDLADRLLPHPGAGSSQRGGKTPPGLLLQISEEIRAYVGLRPDDQSAEAKGKILEYIAEEIAALVLTRADQKALQARVANLNLAR